MRAAGGFPPQCHLTVEDVLWDLTFLNTADVTQLSQSVLSKQIVHSGMTNRIQDIVVFPGYAKDTADASQMECVECVLVTQAL